MSTHWTSSFWLITFFIIYLFTSCSGLYLIKAAEGWRTAAFIIGFALWGMGALIWIALLRLTPLSFAFPIASGALTIGTMLTGVFFLSETVTIKHITGAAMIVSGIALIIASR